MVAGNWRSGDISHCNLCSYILESLILIVAVVYYALVFASAVMLQ